METATLLTLGNLMAIKTCSVTLATVTDNLNKKMDTAVRQKEEERLAQIVLDGLLNYHREESKK